MWKVALGDCSRVKNIIREWSWAVSTRNQAREFAYLVKYGMTPVQAIQNATTVAAEMMGWQDRIGSIEKGKFADVVAVSGDPLKGHNRAWSVSVL
jgi:imidazolonepropionase-like amidohydrolase